jgi:malate dehydrogenase (oxaloacetate-decarboxylating)(NADP+)
MIYAEGEDERILRAAQVVVDEGVGRPLLLGRPDVIRRRIEDFGLRLKLDENYDLADPHDPDVYRAAAQDYYATHSRRGVSIDWASAKMRAGGALVAATLLRLGKADAMLCGATGRTTDHLDIIRDVIGLGGGAQTLGVMQMLMLQERQLFICDTHVNENPSAEQVAEIAIMAAETVRRFGQTARIALLSHSSFGSSNAPSALKMRRAREIVLARAPGLLVEGEMRGDAALSPAILKNAMPESEFSGPANILVMPNIEAANISYNLLRVAAGNGITVGGILMGAAKPVHILTPSATVRRIVNLTALAVADSAALDAAPSPVAADLVPA